MSEISGEVLRAWRRSRGWDVPRLAHQLRESAGDDPPPIHDALVRMIYRWERGKHSLSERYELLYAAALGIEPSLLRRLPINDARAAKSVVPHDPHAPDVIAAIGSALNSSSHRDAEPARTLAAVRRDVVRAWELRQSAQYLSLGSLLTRLLDDTAAWMGASCDGGQAVDAAVASVHTHDMVSSLLKRLGAYEMAAVVADRAFRIADQTGSALLVGAAKLRVANVYLSASRHPEAVAVAAAAAEHLPPKDGSPPEEIATFGALLLTAAVAAARMGQAAQAWEFLGHAKAAVAINSQERADLFAVFGPVNLAVHGVQVATELGDGREALRRAAMVDADRMPAVLLERRSTLLIDIARSQYLQRNLTAAGDALIEAERIAPQEVRYNRGARDLLSDLLRGSRVGSVLRQLAERVGEAA
jgi:transcriptional regulator with XRE-family HTH domain